MISVFSQPIFILGTQRSGTTLLTKILSSNSNIFIQNEISVEKVFSKNASKVKIIQNINDQIRLRQGKSIEEILHDENRSCWGIKDPQLTYHIDALKQFLPNSKFIIIIRDGRAVVNSYMENKWGLGTNAYTGALRWSHEVKLQKEFKDMSPDNFYVLRFEDLIANMEIELRNLCYFLEVDFEPQMLQYFKQDSRYKTNKQNINTDKKPDMNLAKKWKYKLSKGEIDIIDAVARNELISNAYEVINEPISIPKWKITFYKFHQVIIGEIQIQYQLKTISIKKLFKRLLNINNNY